MDQADIVLVELSEEQRLAALKTVHRHTRDIAETRELALMLGLIDPKAVS